MAEPRIVPGGDDEAASLSGAVLFGILWDELVDLLGTQATAAIMRRALHRAVVSERALSGLTITRLDREYGYVVPPSFGNSIGPPAALCELLEELRPLLLELTGQVAIHHLERIPALRNWRTVAPLGPQEPR